MGQRTTGQPIKQLNEPRFFYGYFIVLATFCIFIVCTGSRAFFGVFFKPMTNELGWSSTLISSAFSLSAVMEGIVSIISGRLTDRLGPRKVLISFGIIAGLGFLLMSRISTIWQMYLVYGLLIGIGLGGLFVPAATTVTRWFVARRNLMQGIALTGTGLGSFLAPPIAYYLISIYDWRTSYVIFGIAILIIIVVCANFLRLDPSKMGLRPYGKPTHESKGPAFGLSLTEAVHTRQFWQVCTVFFCLGICMISISVHLVPHIIELNIAASTAANVLATIGGFGIIGRVAFGAVADKIGNRRVVIIGFILISITLFWLISAREIWALYLIAAVLGLAAGGIGTSQSPIVAQLFGLKSHGLIFGVCGFSYMIGAAIGPLMTGYVFDVTGGYQLAFILITALSVFGLAFSLFLKPAETKKPGESL